MTLSTDEPITRVKDGVLDYQKLWALQAYKGLPQVTMVLIPKIGRSR
jgi:hypothetical protein